MYFLGQMQLDSHLVSAALLQKPCMRFAHYHACMLVAVNVHDRRAMIGYDFLACGYETKRVEVE